MNAPLTAPPQPAGASATGFTLLCVDDEANILSALRRLFRPQGYRVLTAGSGAEGLEILAREAVDLVISDMRMPEMDGARFLAQARAHHPDTVRILLTGYADMESTVAAINDGQITRYITKPWNDAEVLLTVREGLERRHLEREKARLEALTRHQNDTLKALNAGLEAKVEARTEALRNTHEKLKQNFVTSVRVFSHLIELRGGVLAGHSRRVADLARKIALRLGLGPAEAQDVMLAGLLHDIGKIGVPDHLLIKPVPQMSGEELGVLRKHVVTGQAALMGLDNLRQVAEMIRAHHEQWDGQGYPDRRAGQDIPLGARILAVPNDYDGLQIGTLSARRLRPEEAADLIRRSRGKRYDPQIVDAFLDVLAGLEGTTGERVLAPDQLEPGMILSRDLLSADGVLLLAADFVLEPSVIDHIRSFAAEDRMAMRVFVRADKEY